MSQNVFVASDVVVTRKTATVTILYIIYRNVIKYYTAVYVETYVLMILTKSEPSNIIIFMEIIYFSFTSRVSTALAYCVKSLRRDLYIYVQQILVK